MRISHLIVWVDDAKEASRFYGQTIGLERLSRADEEDLAFKIGDVQLVIFEDEVMPACDEPSGRVDLACVIEVDDINAIYRDWMAKGVEFEGPPEEVPYIGIATSFSDPAGNAFCLLESFEVHEAGRSS